jgi:hypothetical protein
MNPIRQTMSNNLEGGAGQEMGSSGPIWISTAYPMLATMRRNYPGVIFTHPDMNEVVIWLQLAMFADDATLYATQAGIC